MRGEEFAFFKMRPLNPHIASAVRVSLKNLNCAEPVLPRDATLDPYEIIEGPPRRKVSDIDIKRVHKARSSKGAGPRINDSVHCRRRTKLPAAPQDSVHGGGGT